MLALRSLLILSIGIVLGLGLAVSATVWTALGVEHHAHPKPADAVSPDATALVAEVMDRVRREYVTRIDDRQLVEGAIRGIVKELDSHSSYLDPTQYEEIRISTFRKAFLPSFQGDRLALFADKNLTKHL